EIWALLRRSNKYIDETAPWILAKDEAKKERLGTVLYNLIESIRIASVLLGAFMPETASKIQSQIGATTLSWESLDTFEGTIVGSKVGIAEVLFARIDEKKKLEEIFGVSEVKEVKEEKVAKQPKQAKTENKQSEDGKKTETPIIEGVATAIGIEDFAKIKLTVGEVLKCERVEGSDKLLVSQINIGKEVRQIVSGIAKFYTPEDMIGKKVIVITNLKPVKLRGVMSEGMILAASDEEGRLKIATIDGDIEPGSEVR
ncbi:MAG: methionine--tRNA ligase subunit beta, partial [Vallitaleaceae bacterium]|nr:methionine--tRNA ligase subunit beta [Vallitaleaceae bacterium]